MHVTKLCGFCVVPDSTENAILGKPTLDTLGFVSDQHTIDLRNIEIRFEAILPTNCTDKGSLLQLASHQVFDGRTDAAQVQQVELKADKKLSEGKWWLEAGPDVPDHAASGGRRSTSSNSSRPM